MDDNNSLATNFKLTDPPSRERTPKSMRQLMNYLPIRRVNAIALRHALNLSSSRLNFEIPILYLERLREGGFYEAKVYF